MKSTSAPGLLKGGGVIFNSTLLSSQTRIRLTQNDDTVNLGANVDTENPLLNETIATRVAASRRKTDITLGLLVLIVIALLVLINTLPLW